MRRYKNTIGRIVVELMYGEIVTWTGDRGTTTTTALARKMHTRPIRLVETLQDMARLGYFTELDINYKTITFKLRPYGASRPPRWG